MTSDNEQRVRTALAAMERGDVEALAVDVHPDVEFVNPPYALEPGTRHGVDGLKTAFQHMLDAFDDMRYDLERVIDQGDLVVALGMWSARGRGSQYRFDPLPFAFLITLQDGQLIRYEWFSEHEEALRAAGLAEEAS